VNFWTSSILSIKGDYFFEGVIKVTEYYLADMLGIVYTLAGICSVVLYSKYNVDVALCSSGAIFAAICNDFSRVIFSQP